MSEEEPRVEPAPGILYDAETQIENAIRAYERETGGDGVLLVGWVVIAEWVDTDGNPALSAFAREGMPYWRIDGLIEAAPEAMIYDEEDD